MAKRDVVFIDYKKVVFLIKKIYRNNTIFCEELNKKMGTTRTTKWVSEWKRNSNLPSPHEAAIICILLKTTPDEILLHEGKTPEETAKCLEDIETVRKLVETERAKEKAHDQKIVGENAQLAQFIAKFNRLSPQQKSAVLAVMEGYQPSQE